MADPTGFLHYPRVEIEHRPIPERILDWREVDRPPSDERLLEQAARCMDCGIPFCHSLGCPLENRIPEFNDLAYRGRWREAAENLHSTNNFPEITGRVCPAPCEAACTLAIERRPVNIKMIERQIADRALAADGLRPLRPKQKTGRKVAVVGSGPAGLAAAQQLARAGHRVVVFEKDDRLGGLLRYGIPDFKLEKHLLDRRLEQMVSEGVKFEPNVCAGIDLPAAELLARFDAVLLCIGSGKARTLNVAGADLAGVHLALDFLTRQNRRNAGDPISDGAQPPSAVPYATPPHATAPEDLHSRGRLCSMGRPCSDALHARDKHVVVIGGGDTGSDCVGTAIRQEARSVTQLEILPQPPEEFNPETPWPLWPKILRTSTSQEEGCTRLFSVSTKMLEGRDGRVVRLHGCKVDWTRGPNGWTMSERPGAEFTLPADLVLVAMGFVHAVHEGLATDLGLQFDGAGNLCVDHWMTNAPGIFAAGDAVRGASLVVHAIRQGRLAAAACDRWLCRRG